MTNRTKNYFFVPLIFVTAFVLAACAQSLDAPLDVADGATQTPQYTRTNTPSPTTIPSATPIPPTFTPSPTATPTTWYSEPISAQNIDRLAALKVFGYGSFEDFRENMYHTDDGNLVILPTQGRTCVLNAQTLEEVSCFDYSFGYHNEAFVSLNYAKNLVLNETDYKLETIRLDTGEKKILELDSRRVSLLPGIFISSDDKYLLKSFYEDSEIIYSVWTMDGEFLWQKKLGNARYFTLFFSPDSEVLVESDSKTGKYSLYNTRDGSLLEQFSFGQNVHEMIFSPNGNAVAVVVGAGKNTMQYYSWPERNLLSTFANDTEIEVPKFSKDGSTLAYRESGRRMEVRETTDWKIIANVPLSRLYVYDIYHFSHELSPDGTILAVKSRMPSNVDQTRGEPAIDVWRVGDSQLILSIPGSEFTVSPDGKRIVVISNGKLQTWELESGQLIAEKINSHHYMQFSPDSSLLAVDIGSAQIALFDVAEGKITKILGEKEPNKARGVEKLIFSPDGTLLLAEKSAENRCKNTMEVWDLQTFTLKYEAQPAEPHHCLHYPRFSESGKELAFSRYTQGPPTGNTYFNAVTGELLADIANGQEQDSAYFWNLRWSKVSCGHWAHCTNFGLAEKINNLDYIDLCRHPRGWPAGDFLTLDNLIYADACRHSYVRFYSLEAEKLIYQFAINFVGDFTISPDGKLIALTLEERLFLLGIP
jgi:WD40 repeat protein